jgi:hypothetical protein
MPPPLRGETVEIASTGFTRGYNRAPLRGVQEGARRYMRMPETLDGKAGCGDEAAMRQSNRNRAETG